MARRVEIERERTLDDHEQVAHLAPAVQALRAEARRLVPRLDDRTIWMVNSTSRGGGVAEMLPGLMGVLRDLGVDVEWLVIESDRPAFFPLTKRIHNLVHGEGDPDFAVEDRELYEEVNRANAREAAEAIRPGDVVVAHDPQPMALPGVLREETDVRAVWRCHIGLDEENRATRSVWRFLEPYAEAYDRAVFSAPEYIPKYLAGRSTVIHPALDPLTDKNRDLSLHKIVGTLVNARLARSPGPVMGSEFEAPARRLQPDGTFAPADRPDDIGLLQRPIVTQVSRWDRLKGFGPLLRAFARLKRGSLEAAGSASRHRRRREIVRLVLAGPDPESVQDDPDAVAVLDELKAMYLDLEPAVREDVVLVSLPMRSRKENALMVNALQRASSVVVQNSLREGFGLTVTEAMWKGVPVLSSRRACGPRHQVRDDLDGRLVQDPEDVEELAAVLDEMLRHPAARDRWGRTAQRRAHDLFLVFTQAGAWLELLAEVCEA